MGLFTLVSDAIFIFKNHDNFRFESSTYRPYIQHIILHFSAVVKLTVCFQGVEGGILAYERILCFKDYILTSSGVSLRQVCAWTWCPLKTAAVSNWCDGRSVIHLDERLILVNDTPCRPPPTATPAGVMEPAAARLRTRPDVRRRGGPGPAAPPESPLNLCAPANARRFRFFLLPAAAAAGYALLFRCTSARLAFL